ncbi:MAG TPA: ATP-binding protein [Polyangia bacterium]|nr:ATP-binding protein [Polyangia bacterium]
MRSMDWSQSPLGPVDEWPQSLRTCLRIILTSRQPMFVWWGRELINLYNDAYRAIVGGKHPKALGQPASVVWREIWDQIRPRAEQAMKGNEGTYDEALLLIMERHGYQEETYYTFSYSPVPDERDGVGGIICANTDDTRRIIGERRLALLRELGARTVDARRAEEACAAAALALATERRDLPFSLIYLVAPGGEEVVLAGAAGIQPGHGAAPARLRLSGGSPWPVGEVLRSQEHRVIDLPAGDADLPTEPWGRPPSRAVIWPLAAPGKTAPAGALIAALNPFRPFDQDYTSFISLVAGQIAASTATAQAYEEERRRAEALAEIDRAKTAFFSNVSHEFRTPLTLMLGPQEDALESPEGVLAGEDLKAVHRNTLRLLKLVNNLLDFSRIEAGRAQARYEPTDLAAVTTDLASAFRSAIERGGIRFDVSCPPVAQPVFVDRAMWETIVLNLLSNAFKFTLRGRIAIRLREVGRAVELEVTDTGAGIPDEELPHMFERFHRVETTEARTHEGTGIGLALVSELVRLHGGQIAVSSREGEGSTFKVTIPLGDEHLPREHVSREATAAKSELGTASFVEEALRWLPAEEAGQGSDAREAGVDAERPPVLVADDNADMRDYIARLLRPHWRVSTAADGLEALALARAHHPSLIVADVMMPKLDGFGLLRAVRTDPQLSATPVMLLSARAGEESRVEGLDAGADDYLVKPFRAKELVARVRAHLEAVRLRQAAEAERNRLRSLLGQLPAIVNFLRGPDLIIEFAHPMTVAALGGREIVGKPLLEAIPEFRDQEYPVLLRRVLETGERITGHERLVRLADASGGLRDTYWSFVYLPVRDRQGRVEGVMTFDLEVTEQVLARVQIQDQTAALAEANRDAERARALAETANRAKDEFLAMLGHELRNPLAPILTALQLMRLRAGGSREQEVIERQVGHLTRLVDDLLDVSRVTRGKIELRKRPVELAEVTLRALETVSPILELQRHEVDVRVPRRGLVVDADPDRLAQVISNLLTNAAKYSDAASRIEIRGARLGDRVTFTVRDEGIGLAPDMVDRVFDVFVQQPQALDRSRGGLGLGLTIVRSLVALHGGTVRAESAGPGKGSQFIIELPASAARPARPAPRAPAKPRKKTLLGKVRDKSPLEQRILIVDDNHDAAETLAEVLVDMGYAVMVAHDGPEALSIAGAFHPRIALVDIGLPVMDGYELARRLRSDEQTKDLHLVAVTGYGLEADRRRAKDAGFERHLVKPVDLDVLERVVGELRSQSGDHPATMER